MAQLLDISICYHCGDKCLDLIEAHGHHFCCPGCKQVYELLLQNNLCDYYQIEQAPGITRKSSSSQNRYQYLDDLSVGQKLIDYEDDRIVKTHFFIPAMHCNSCIWLLENLYRLDQGIASARVNFLKKTVSISFQKERTSLRKVVELLSGIGYEPLISLNDAEPVKKERGNKLTYQIGIAGFCFGNVMLISFPEYFGLDEFTHHTFSKLFGYINLLLSLPVFFFCAQDYFKNAYKGLRKKYISIDIPLALGILVLFVRSIYEVATGTGIGYFDTHAGLVFFLLIGRWFQQKTFDTLSFERDYKSYFPIAVSVWKNDNETTVPVNSLVIGDRIIIRNNELIPADAILLKGDATIDFSFVTGESDPVSKVLGEVVYAGGRQVGQTIELEICKKVSQSYLTQLWNSEHFTKPVDSRIKTFQQTVSRYFTIALLVIAIGAALWWSVFNPSLVLNAFSSVLIIACPCALALSSPFALGTAMRILGYLKCYVKAPEVVEQMAGVDTIVFDKTGTLTQPGKSSIVYIGENLSDEEKSMIVSLARNSVHPLSRQICSFFPAKQTYPVREFKELSGKGIEGFVNNKFLQIGSMAYLFPFKNNPTTYPQVKPATRVLMKLDSKMVGYFLVRHKYRNNLEKILSSLRPQQDLFLLSGDNTSEERSLKDLFGTNKNLFFNQSPIDKLAFIQTLQEQNKKVMMIGDGLNDAGALKAADVGISLTENTAHFTPASDVIMDVSVFEKLPQLIQFSKNTRKVIHISFIISLIYNIIGLSFAVQGTLSPLIAAILMPLSSITVIAFTTISTTLYAKKGGLKWE